MTRRRDAASELAGTELTMASRQGRSLTTTVAHCRHLDPLDDPLVDEVLREIRRDGSAGRVCRWLAAFTLFALDRVNVHRRLAAEPPLSVEVLERALLSEATVDSALVRDCFAVLRGMRDPRGSTRPLNEQVTLTVETWGPYALTLSAILAWRVVVTAAAGLPGATPDQVLQAWALADESVLASRGSKTKQPKRKERDD